MLDAVTYPDPEVAKAINERFLPVQINTQDEANTAVVERFRQIWTLDIRILGVDGFDYYQWNGYLPPFEYLPQLLAGEARAHLRGGDAKAAATLHQEVVRRFPTSAVAPEAQYYIAIANYTASGQARALVTGWHQVRSQYPNSIWRVKQLFMESS
jgi:hypothetical protein